RPPMPDTLGAQIEPLLEAVEKIGIPIVRVPGIEADDVIGSLAKRAAEAGLATVISTSDKDMAQLVDGRITLVDTMPRRGPRQAAVRQRSDDWKPIDAAAVKKKFGVGPARIADYLAIVGDSVDNIPGIPGAGPKTAVKWLEQYGSLENLIEHADEIGGKIGETLREKVGALPRFKDLATIRCG